MSPSPLPQTIAQPGAALPRRVCDKLLRRQTNLQRPPTLVPCDNIVPVSPCPQQRLKCVKETWVEIAILTERPNDRIARMKTGAWNESVRNRNIG